MEIDDKILSLIKYIDPDDPITYLNNIVKEYALDKINSNIQNCNKCDLCKFKTKSIGYGNIYSDILIVSEHISLNQYNSGDSLTLPLDDEYGELFRKVVEQVINANYDYLYFVNCVNCFSGKDSKGKIVERPPTVEERKTCRKLYLDKIIDIMKPNIIICLGAIAINSLYENPKNTSSIGISVLSGRGKIFSYRGYEVMPTFHPSYFKLMEKKEDPEIMDSYKDNFIEDLYNAFSMAKDKNPNCNIGDIVNVVNE